MHSFLFFSFLVLFLLSLLIQEEPMFRSLLTLQRSTTQNIFQNSSRFFAKAAKESKKITKKSVAIYSLTAVTLGGSAWLYFYSTNDDFKLKMNRDYISKWPALYRRLSRSFPDVPLPPLNRDIYDGSQLQTLFCEWFCINDFNNRMHLFFNCKCIYLAFCLAKGLKREDLVSFLQTMIPITEEDANELYAAKTLESVLNDYRMPNHRVFEGASKTISIDEALFFFIQMVQKYQVNQEELVKQLESVLEAHQRSKEGYEHPQYTNSYKYVFDEFYKSHHTSKQEMVGVILRQKEYEHLKEELKEIEENYYNAKYELERMVTDEKEMYTLPKEEYTEEDVQYYKEQKAQIKREMNEYYSQMKKKQYEVNHFKI